MRVSQLSGDKRSSYDSSKSQTPGQSSLDGSGPAGIESSLLTDNFKELLLDPVDVQLQKLLGPNAEDFLHPTFREGAKKTLNPMVVQRKCKYSCVRACVRACSVRAKRASEFACARTLRCRRENVGFCPVIATFLPTCRPSMLH